MYVHEELMICDILVSFYFQNETLIFEVSWYVWCNIYQWCFHVVLAQLIDSEVCKMDQSCEHLVEKHC